ncbi:MAG: zinc ribbon domain-containing protein [Lachnospiraceae bacterium]|nr:zinc ribbon domain-containing protein [Lachnospiraceae bacterium]
MDFFGQIGKKLADAGHEVAQKTQNFTEMTRLNGIISEKEKKLKQLYTVIGEYYYEQHKDDSTAECRDFIIEIRLLMEEIDQCKEELRKIKGTGKCTECGAEVVADAAFCNVCGARIVQQQVQSSLDIEGKVCPNCSTVVAIDNLFCDRCGTKLE